jgi:predicted outer membrane protein
MKNRLALFAAVAVMGASVSNALALDQNTTTTTTTTMMVMPADDHLSVSDRIFLMDLAHANAREIELSRVAFHQGESQGVVYYARHMLRDHRQLQDQIMSTYGNRPFMMNWEGVVSRSTTPVGDNWIGGSWDDSMDNGKDRPSYNNWNFIYPDDWSAIHELRNSNGKTLDRMYLSEMAVDHAKLLDEINRESETTNNPDIKALIANIQPIVEHHLHLARDWKLDYDDPQFKNASGWDN